MMMPGSLYVDSKSVAGQVHGTCDQTVLSALDMKSKWCDIKNTKESEYLSKGKQ